MGSDRANHRDDQQCQWRGKPACLGKILASAPSTPYPRFAVALTGEQPPTAWENFLQKSGCQGFTETETDRAAQIHKFLQGRGLRVLYLRGQLQEEELIF